MNPLAKWLKNASNLFNEKPQVKVDEFGLEHFLLYHGLVGSSPENQREFKDVRADIASAVARGNSHNLCINIKLAPLWWEDKLYRIFEELKEQSPAQAVSTLLPAKSDDYEVHDFDPLRHQDWRVRANAALVLAHLKEESAQERIIQAMDATADNTTPAFCHISRAVAGFRSNLAKNALKHYLSHKEPWIRVDAVNALARWPIAEVGEILGSAFKEHHDFLDYAAVALAKQHQPESLLQHESDKIIDLGSALTIGLIDASRDTFSSNSDLFLEVGLHRCLEPLQEAAQQKPHPVRVRALRNLASWLEDNRSKNLEAGIGSEEHYPSRQVIDQALATGRDGELRRRLVAEIEALALNSHEDQKETSNLRHALKLIGELNLDETSELLLALIDVDRAKQHRNEIVEAMGKLGEAKFAAKLVVLVNQLVDLNSRLDLPLSASPVEEKDPDASRTYWFALKALGNIADRSSFDLLIRACGDHAADKREEALSSAVKAWKLLTAGAEDKVALADVKAAVTRALGDPSAQVKIKALEGAAVLNLAELVPGAAKLSCAQEISVSRVSFEALESLAAGGHKAAVKEALSEVRRSQSHANRNKKIDELLAQLG
jgi:HEAT repeat protein